MPCQTASQPSDPSSSRGAHCGARRGGPWAARGHCGGRGGRFSMPFMAGPWQAGGPWQHGHGCHGHWRGQRGRNGSESFTPPVDVFEAPDAYVIHIALAGARMEDIGVTWEPAAGAGDDGAVVVAGVVHRPGVDEELMGGLRVDERSGRGVGAFERKIILGGVNDEEGEGIKAKLEAGVLVITVPRKEKKEKEVRKVEVVVAGHEKRSEDEDGEDSETEKEDDFIDLETEMSNPPPAY